MRLPSPPAHLCLAVFIPQQAEGASGGALAGWAQLCASARKGAR